MSVHLAFVFVTLVASAVSHIAAIDFPATWLYGTLDVFSFSGHAQPSYGL